MLPINSLINDKALNAAQSALDGLALQQQVISRNIANVDTPGYQAQSVDFESALQSALGSSQSQQSRLALASTDSRHLAAGTISSTPARLTLRQGGSERADGNNVNIDDELVAMSQTGIQYQAMTELVGQKYALLSALTNAH